MTHIGGYPGRYPARIRTQIQRFKPGLFICGHSHMLKVMPDPQYQLLHINPGAAGNHGFHLVKTLVRFSITAGKIHDLQVIELGPRAQRISLKSGSNCRSRPAGVSRKVIDCPFLSNILSAGKP